MHLVRSTTSLFDDMPAYSSVRPPIIFTDLPTPARRGASRSEALTPTSPAGIITIICATLALTGLIMITYYTRKNFLPWYRRHRKQQHLKTKQKQSKAERAQQLRHIFLPFLPVLGPIEEVHRTTDLEKGISSFKKVPPITRPKSDLPFRNLASPPETSPIVLTELIVVVPDSAYTMSDELMSVTLLESSGEYQNIDRGSCETNRTGVSGTSTNVSIREATPMEVVLARGELSGSSGADRVMHQVHPGNVDGSSFVIGEDEEDSEEEG